MAGLRVICDLDGVVADNRWRLPLVDRGREGGADWDAYYAGVGRDPIVPEGVALVRALIDGGAAVEFWTGREGRGQTREATCAWLDAVFGVGAAGRLTRMREVGDRQTNAKLKRSWAARVARACGTDGVLFIDDNPGAVDGYASLGFAAILFRAGRD